MLLGALLLFFVINLHFVLHMVTGGTDINIFPPQLSSLVELYIVTILSLGLEAMAQLFPFFIAIMFAWEIEQSCEIVLI